MHRAAAAAFAYSIACGLRLSAPPICWFLIRWSMVFSRRSIRGRYERGGVMTSIEVLRLINSIRQDIPCNQMVMCLCDECERLILAPPMVKRRDPLVQAEIQRIENSRPRREAAPVKSS